MKRVALTLYSKKSPETLLQGYALVNELQDHQFSFFCTVKFKMDEELHVFVNLDGHAFEYDLKLSHFYEEISSGRIMNRLPTPDDPFPARKFYRCVAKVIEQPASVLTEPSAPEIGLQAVPDPTSVVDEPIASAA